MASFLKNGYLVAFVLLAFMATNGCGKKDGTETRLTPVEGSVFLDGKPLAHADIEFHFKGTVPESYTGAASRSDERGVFQVKSGDQLGTLPGPHIVTVRRGQDASGVEPPVEIPQQYTSPDTSKLQIDVRKDKWIGYALQLSTAAE